LPRARVCSAQDDKGRGGAREERSCCAGDDRSRNVVRQEGGVGLDLLELGVTLDEFFGAAAGEGYGDAAVVFIAFDGDDGADAEFGVADFAAHEGIAGAGTLAAAKGSGGEG